MHLPQSSPSAQAFACSPSIRGAPCGPPVQRMRCTLLRRRSPARRRSRAPLAGHPCNVCVAPILWGREKRRPHALDRWHEHLHGIGPIRNCYRSIVCCCPAAMPQFTIMRVGRLQAQTLGQTSRVSFSNASRPDLPDLCAAPASRRDWRRMSELATIGVARCGLNGVG